MESRRRDRLCADDLERAVSVFAGGGRSERVTSFEPKQIRHRWPWFLPDGKRFLYRPMWSPDGNELFYASGDTIMRVPIGDGASLKPGTPTPLFRIPDITPRRAAPDRIGVAARDQRHHARQAALPLPARHGARAAVDQCRAELAEGASGAVARNDATDAEIAQEVIGMSLEGSRLDSGYL